MSGIIKEHLFVSQDIYHAASESVEKVRKCDVEGGKMNIKHCSVDEKSGTENSLDNVISSAPETDGDDIPHGRIVIALAIGLFIITAIAAGSSLFSINGFQFGYRAIGANHAQHQRLLLKKIKHDSASTEDVGTLSNTSDTLSISVDGILFDRALEFMLNQEDIQELLEKNPGANVRNSDLNAGEKINQRYTMLNMWASLSKNVGPLPNDDECEWDEVKCDDGVVEKLYFARKGWSGTISKEIAKLKSLRYIDIAENNIKGSIPDELYTLEDLQHLYLHDNSLTGTLSESIRNLDELRTLHLCRNNLSGNLPQGLERTKLEMLSLCYNQFTGRIPEELELWRLTYLDLSFNSLSGTISSDVFEDYDSLDHLYLDHNKLKGKIPRNLVTAGRGNIEQIYLSHNGFTGEFPSPSSWTSGNNKLITIEVQDNKLNRDIDDNICEMSVFELGDLVQIQADCDICDCRGSTELCNHC